MSDNRRIAIMGGSESGKTALAIALSRGLWHRGKVRTLAFDPFKKKHRWEPQFVTDDFDQFELVVFKVNGCAVFWDEGTSTGGRDRDKVKFFTAIRHNHEFFAFIGHDYTTMLPIMRGSLTDVILFRQSESAAQYWSDLFTDKDILRTTQLEQYAAIHKRAFRPVRDLTFSKEEIESKEGVTL